MPIREKKKKQRLEIYEKAIEKQLHDDFQVNEYLNHNQLEGNIQEYLKLVNSLLVNNQQKRKKYDSLQVSFNQMSTDRLDNTCQLSKVSNWESSKQSFMTKFQQTQIKTSNQIEVKNTLWNEIIQTKKSINLLKGDIGHLVNRNESSNILSSKVSKVKYVADDQLKRVTLAFSKDKDEIKQRKDMQQKFNKKLKNVSLFQNTSMNKLKETYVNVMVRKRRMHDRLAYIEKLSASIYQTEDKERQKNRINKETLQLYKNFEKLIKLIEKMPELQEKYSNSQQTSIKDFVNEITNLCSIRNEKTSRTHGLSSRGSKTYESNKQQSINSADLQMVNEQNLSRFEKIVKHQFERISEQIQFRKIKYNSKVKMTQNLATKLSEVNHEITKIQLHWLNEAISQYVQTPSMKEQYLQKLNDFIYMIKTYFVLLEFIEKHLNYSAMVSNQEKKLSRQHKNEKIFSKTQSVNMRKSGNTLTRSLIFSTTHSSKNISSWNKSLAMAKKSYISDLHKIYYALMREDQSDFKLDDINDDFFQQLGADVQEWLNQIKEKIKEESFFIKPSLYQSVTRLERDDTLNCHQLIKRRDDHFSNNKKAKTYIENDEDQVIEVREQYENYLEDFNERQIQNEENNVVRYNSAVNFNDKNSHLGSTTGFFPDKGLYHSFHSKIANFSKLKSLSKSSLLHSEKKAMRIKFLQNVDKDYYKMIKSTIQMEKQNTRKNYKFLKTFNRTKYEPNDEILEEKRFQSSFSTLFTSGNNDSNPIKEEPSGKKSFFYTNNKSQNRISKLQQSQRPIKSSQVFRSLNLEKLTADRKQVASAKKWVPKSKDHSLFQSKHQLSLQVKEIINLV